MVGILKSILLHIITASYRYRDNSIGRKFKYYKVLPSLASTCLSHADSLRPVLGKIYSFGPNRAAVAGLLAISLIFLCGSAALSAPQRKVLIINSYHKGYEWSDDIVAAAQTVLSEGIANLDLSVEYMDTKRWISEKQLQLFREWLRVKYSNVSFDLIISSDDRALLFILEYHDELFPGVPVVFCGINDYQSEMITGTRNLTGLVEVLDIGPTIDLGLKLHHGTTRIGVITDNTITGLNQRRAIADVVKDYPNVTFEYLNGEDLTTEELLVKVREFPSGNFILAVIWMRDKNGFIPNHMEIIETVAEHSAVPFYGLSEPYLNRGIVGGKLNSGHTHGRLAAEIALQILLNGKKPSEIPVITYSTNQFMFDYKWMTRFGISDSHLPKGSTVINRPFSFYETYKALVWSVLGIFTALVFFILILSINIIRRTRAENALRKSEERYRMLVETMTEGLVVIDRNRILRYINTSLSEMLGYQREEILGKHAFCFFDATNRKIVQNQLAKRERGEKEAYEIEWIKKDGDKLITIVSPQLIYDGDEFKGSFAVITDITERKRTKDALRESAEKYRSLTNDVLDTSEVGICILDKDFRIVWVNQALERFLGLRRDEVIGVKNRQLICERIKDIFEDPESFAEKVIATYGNNTYIEKFECHIVPKGERKERWLEHWSQPIRSGLYAGGRIEHYTDFSERKRAEEALLESEERYRAVIEDMPAMICRLLPDGTFTFVSNSYCNYYDKNREGLIGRNLFQFIPGNSQEKVRKDFASLNPERPTITFKYQVIAPDGNIRWQQWTGRALFDEQGHLLEYQCLGMDITEEKLAQDEKIKLEKQLQHAQKMKAIGTLAGGIAHDFNNLLVGIQGHASLMMVDVEPSHPNFEHLKGIDDCVKSAVDLTKQLLGFARSGKYDVKPTDINALVKNSLEMFGRTRKEISLHTKYQKDVWTVEVDQGQIQQVLLNLYVNAWQAMAGGGNLYVQTENVTLDKNYVKFIDAEPGRYVKISVADTGVGMDKTTQQKIFDPFFTTKEIGKGTGLGLATAYGIVKNHRGVIHVYSEKGKGATFTIYLPPSEKQVVENRRLPVELLKGTGTILLVDDEDIVIDLGKRMLETLGYQVFTARSGKEALEIYKASKAKIDIVVLDMIMPEMDGGQAFERLRAINSDVKVLLSSGYSINGQAQNILARGCNGFIQKPFSMNELSQKLREILDVE